MNVKEFSVKVDRSRLIAHESSHGSLLTIENSHKYPILVQTRIINEDKKGKSEHFIATPPIFRLNEGQKSKIRIYKKIQSIFLKIKKAYSGHVQKEFHLLKKIYGLKKMQKAKKTIKPC
ncbi:fimbria/pilus periplasmic chaperone [Escherichia coli]|nr:fimbria/pilus periplasmic chaperone [Escherichia coli]